MGVLSDRGRRRVVAFVVGATGAVVAAAATSPPAFAYPTPPGSGVVRTTCVTAHAGKSCPLAFQFFTANDQPESSVAADFTTSGGGGVSPVSATTDALGQVQALFTASDTQCGPTTVTASTADARVQTTVNVACAVTAGATTGAAGGLPATSMLTPKSGVPWWPPALAALAIAGLLAAATLFTASRRRSPRRVA